MTTTNTREATARPRNRVSIDEYLVRLKDSHRDIIEANDRDGLMAVIYSEAPRYIVDDMARAFLNLRWNTIYHARPAPAAATVLPRLRRQRARANAVDAIVATGVALMSLVMPNGKTLGDCTREDVLGFSGWAASIAERLQPGQKVSDVLTERQLKAALRATLPV